MKELANQLKKEIWKLLKESAIDGSIEVAKIPRLLREKLGVEWKEYMESGASGGCKKWLCTEFEVTEDPDNNYYLLLNENNGSESDQQLKGKIEGILTANLNAEGYLVNSSIPSLLMTYGIEWKKLADGANFEEWIEKEFPSFWIDKSGKAPCIRRGREMKEEGNELDVKSYPVNIDIESKDSILEVKEMHQFAYMGWWSNTSKLLRNMTGFRGNNENVWRGIIARQMALAKLNVEGRSYFESLDDEDSGIAFKTGLKTSEGKTIYGILRKNLQRKRASQKWVLSCFCYPGQIGEGQWLVRKFSIPSENESNYERVHDELLMHIKNLREIQIILANTMDEFSQSIVDGRRLDKETFLKIEGYNNLWNNILEKLEIINAENLLKNKKLKLEELDTYISGNEVYYEMLDQAVTKFSIMTQELYDWMIQRHLTSSSIEKTSMYRDNEKINQLYNVKSNAFKDFSDFFEIIENYKSLKTIVDNDTLNDDKVMDASEKVSKHFNIPLRVIGMFLIGTGPVKTLENIELISDILNQCISADEVKGKAFKEHDYEIEQTANNILSYSVKAVFSADGISKENLKRLFAFENEFEKYIITNQIDDAVKLCSDSKKMLSLGYSQEEIEKINSVLLYKKEMPGSLKEFFCACRLLKIQENKNRQAEKYLLLADKTNDTISQILDIYRREERIEDFLLVYEKYCDDYNIDFVNKSFLVQIYSKYMMNDKLIELVEKHPEVTYDDQNLSHIITTLTDNTEEQSLVKILRERKRRLEEHPTMNIFEEALVNFDQMEISRLANDKELLLENGYTEEEQEVIYQSLMLGEYTRQTENSQEFEIGCRVYSFQGNKHMLAEQFFWKGLKQSDLSMQCLKIFEILNNERRWHECRALYEAYENRLKSVESARKYYIMALIRLDINLICDMIDKNLMDFLDEKIFALLQSNAKNERSLTYTKKIKEILDRIDNEYITSVVYINSELREFIVHPERMEEYGVFSDESRAVVNTFKNDLFTYGSCALDIAKRVYVFWKNRNNLAELLATMALPETEAAIFLMNMYEEACDYNKMDNIFEQIPDLINEKPLDYMKILFYKKEYEKYLEIYENMDDGALQPLLRVEAVISYIITEKCSVGELEEKSFCLNEEIVKTYPWLMVRLMSVISKKEKYDVFERLLNNYFDLVVNNYTPEMTEDFITAGKTLDENRLLLIQKKNVDQGDLGVAVYLYNVLNIGDEEELSSEFYKRSMRAIEEMDEQEKLIRINFLDKLYPEMHSELYRLGVSCGLKKLLYSNKTDVEKKQILLDILHDVKMDKELFQEIKSYFEELTYLSTPSICQELYYSCKAANCIEQVLILFSERAVNMWNESKLDLNYYKFICKIYIDAIMNNNFPESICSKAIFICRKYMEESENCEAAFCLYKLYQMQENYQMAELAFLYIMDTSPSELSVEIYEQISEDIKLYSNKVATRLFDVFKQELAVRKADEIMGFIDETKCFIRLNQPSIEFLKRIEEEGNDTVYSEDESEYLLKVLFRNANSSKLWAECVNLPFKSEPDLYAKILYNIAKNNAGSWRECVEYCEKYELKKLMFEAIYCWLCGRQDWGEIIECQKFLMNLENNTDYLEEFEDKSILTGIVERLCQTYDLPGMSEEMSHEAIRSIAVVAVGCGMEEILYNYFSDILATKESYVGTVVVSSLLLKGRIVYAYKLLQKMSANINNCPFRPLIVQLAKCSEKELEEEAKKTVLQHILQLSLPKGNRPNIESVHEFILNSLFEKKTKDAAETLNYFLNIFKDDIVYYSGLLLLCKEPFEGCELYLQKGLYGLALLPKSNYKLKIIYQLEERSYKKWFCMVTALVKQKYNENKLLDDYKADEAIGTYYEKCNPMASTGEIIEINDYYNQIKNLFDNRSVEEKEFLYDIILACVTGNWKKMLLFMYEKGIDASPYEEFFKNSNDGILRSILQIYRAYSEKECEDFNKWIMPVLEKWFPDLQKRIKLICTKELLCEKEGIRNFRNIDLYLKYPFEEHFVFKTLYEKVVKNADSDTLFDAYLVAGILSMSKELARQCFEAAAESFKLSNDARACDLYSVSYMLAYRLNLYHVANQKSYPFLLVQYMSRARISGCFAGKKKFQTNIGNEELGSWDCANLILQLLNTSRANEINRLKQYIAPCKRRFCDVIIICVNQKLTDEYKISSVDAVEDPMERCILCQILTFKYKDKFPYLKSSNNYESVKYIMDKILEQEDDNPNFKNGRLKHTLNIPPFVHMSLYDQKGVNEFSEVKKYERTADTEKRLPLFIEKIEQELADVRLMNDLEKLKSDYRKLPLEDKNTRKELSKEMYLSAKKNNVSPAELDKLIIQAGIDYYRCDFDKDVLFETAMYTEYIGYDSFGYKMFRELGPSALFNVFSEYTQITDLVNSYKNNKEAFEILRETLESDLAKEIVGGFYSIIDELVLIYSLVTVSNNASLQKQLRLVYRKFEDIEYSREWSDIKNRLQMLINVEINNLSRCPILVCEVLNQGINTANGRIYGQISNIGREKAEKLTLQVIINGNVHSAKYQLNMLYPQNKAAFELNYAVDDDCFQIQYEIMISYVYKGEICSAESKSGTLSLSVPRTYNLPDYNLSTIRTFVVDDNGEIVSGKDNVLFGRDNEKNRIKQTFSGAFEEYKDILVRGVRRTGKTSLLNYMSVYISNFCTDVIPVYVDCQNATANQFIQSVFVDMVLDKLEKMVPELTQNYKWTEFRKVWKLSESEQDRNPRLLENFYWELSRYLDHKKLVLIFDEVDTLFEKVSQKQGLDTNLFPALGAILCSMDMSKIVHFVFCGSNNLIKYSMDGGVLNQFFQRFGNVMEIGRLPMQDMNAVIQKSCGEKSEIVYTKEALDWTWRLTGGLVWHVKALGQEVLKRARSENRNVIYPSDICYGINSIAADDYCRQFIEGCGQIECRVIDAFQSLVDHENDYISREDIIVLLAGQYEKRVIDQSLSFLVKLDILEKSMIDGEEVFKYTLDLYRRYFKNRLPEESRMQEADTLFRYVHIREKKY